MIRVILDTFAEDARAIQITKAVRSSSSLNLREAKALVESFLEGNAQGVDLEGHAQASQFLELLGSLGVTAHISSRVARP